MTIKRRLLISNIIFVFLSFFTIIVANNVMHFLAGGGQGFRVTQVPDSSLILGIEDNSFLASEVDNALSQIGSGLHQLAEGGYVLIIPEHFHELFNGLTESNESVVFDIGRFSLPSEVVQERFEFQSRYDSWIILGVLLVLGLLATFIFRKLLLIPIEKSIVDLEIGVEEVGEDNLNYRIDHKRGNEFDNVYESFNEMVKKLSEMTEQKKLDENSRKELIAGISHDLKTPLTSINAYAEGIKKGVAMTPEMQEKYMNVIQSKVQDMTYIINQLFLFSKIDLGEFPFSIETVDIGLELNKMVAGFVDDYEDKDVEIIFSKNVENVSAEIDVVQLKNVVQNIISNSIKYGSQIDGKIDIFLEKQNNNIAITIRDNGSGMNDDTLQHMFDVFYRGDISRNSAVKGSGLGLAISSKIIKRLNGTIEADNSPKGGLVTIIRLPIRVEKEDVR